MRNDRQQYDDSDSQAPDRLIQAFKELEPERIEVPSAVDDAILREAKRHLCPSADPVSAPSLMSRITNWLNQWRLVPWAAAAASLVLAGWLIQSSFRTRPMTNVEDFNQDGHVDILDAFALARQVAQGQPVDLELDLNGDGIVDRRDADFLAMQAVRINPIQPL